MYTSDMYIPGENEAVDNDDVALDESSVTPATDVSQDDSETDAALDDPITSPAMDVSPDDAQVEEPDDAQRPSRWQRMQRIYQHPAFKPTVTILGGLAYIGVSIWRLASPAEADEVVDSDDDDVDSADEFQETEADSDCRESRRSPVKHSVREHTRTQHYGPGNEETKTVKIGDYTRGVADYDGIDDEDDDDYDERLSVYDAADYWMSSGKDEDFMFGYSQEELRTALNS